MATDPRFRLERNGMLALTEYAPGASVVAGDHLLRSKGLLKRWTTEGQAEPGVYLHYTMTEDGIEYSEILSPGLTRKALLVKGGFVVPPWAPPIHRFNAEREGTLAVSATVRGGEEVYKETLMETPLVADYIEDGRIVALNRGGDGEGFALCLLCGFAMSEKEPVANDAPLPTGFGHPPLWANSRRSNCPCTVATARRNLALAALQTTNVLRIGPAQGFGSSQAALAGALALARAGAELLGIESREIGATTSKGILGEADDVYHAVLWDENAGGSGLLRDLCDMGEEWIERARRILTVSEDHNKHCEHGCIECLLGFSTQSYVQQRKLDRREGLKGLGGALP